MKIQVIHTARFARPSDGLIFFTSPDRAAPLVFRLAATVSGTMIYSGAVTLEVCLNVVRTVGVNQRPRVSWCGPGS